VSGRGYPGLQREGVLFQPHHSRSVLRGGSPRQDRGTAAASDTSCGSGRSRHNGTQDPCGFAPTRTADSRSVSSGPKCKQFASDKMLKIVVMVVQQIMTELNSAMVEKDKIVAITKIVLNLMKQNGH
jgi:hypothetical protein